jgi:histone H2A
MATAKKTKTPTAAKSAAEAEKKESAPVVLTKAEKNKKAAKAPSPVKTRKRAKANYSGFSSYTTKVLKQVHPDTGINKGALGMVNRFVDEFMRAVAEASNGLLELSHHKTVDSRVIRSAVQIVLPAELSKHGQAEGIKAMVAYNATQVAEGAKAPKREGTGAKRSVRANLTFPITRVERQLRGMLAGRKRVGAGAGVYLTAVVEYLVAEILELAGNTARDMKKTRVTPRQIRLAFGNDDDLSAFALSHRLVFQGGVLPNIHSVLLPSKGKSKEVVEAY